MDSTILESVDSPSSPFLPICGDSNIEINESQLKQEGNNENEYDIQQDMVNCVHCEKLVKKNKNLKVESKKLAKELTSSIDWLGN